jgi:hypothetical protein
MANIAPPERHFTNASQDGAKAFLFIANLTSSKKALSALIPLSQNSEQASDGFLFLIL